MYYENMEFKKINDLQAEQTALKQLTIKYGWPSYCLA